MEIMDFLFEIKKIFPKIGSARNQNHYVSCLVSAKPGKIWPLKNPKSFFPNFFFFAKFC